MANRKKYVHKSWGKPTWDQKAWSAQRRSAESWSAQSWKKGNKRPALGKKEPTQSWKHSSSGSAAQPAIQRGRRTAEQASPHASHAGSKARKADRGRSSAARPAHGASHAGSKRIKPGVASARADSTAEQFQEDRQLSCVAYVRIPTFARLGALRTQRIRAGRSVLDRIQSVQERGADIINIAFERACDLDSLWQDHDMKAKTEKMEFLYSKYTAARAGLLTLFSRNCGPPMLEQHGIEDGDGVPALMLHLEKGPHEHLGDIIIINAACPRDFSHRHRTSRTEGPWHVFDS